MTDGILPDKLACTQLTRLRTIEETQTEHAKQISELSSEIRAMAKKALLYVTTAAALAPQIVDLLRQLLGK
jgi:hypothetical protein